MATGIEPKLVEQDARRSRLEASYEDKEGRPVKGQKTFRSGPVGHKTWIGLPGWPPVLIVRVFNGFASDKSISVQHAFVKHHTLGHSRN